MYNKMLLSHKKELHLVICNNMAELEVIMLSEISQKQNDKYDYDLIHMECKKTGDLMEAKEIMLVTRVQAE